MSNKYSDKLLSVVLPCLNESENINSTYETISVILKDLGINYEIIFVDNGGTDDQLDLMKILYSKDPDHVKIISLSRNFGYQMSLSAGLEYSNGDAVILIDADLQDPPSMIKDFLDEWSKGYQVVYGVRKKRIGGHWFQRFFYKIFYRVFNITSDVHIPHDAGEFGLMDRKVINHIKSMPERVRFIRGLRAWVGYKSKGIEYTRLDREKGSSFATSLNWAPFALDGILSFTTKILSYAFLFSMVIFMLALAFIFYTIWWYFEYKDGLMAGISSLLVLTAFFNGIIIFMLGLVGAFVERIFLEVKERPRFIVQETIGLK
tara:strand:+ start:2581 stop:3534 length:954 start_codon:yes stop_codon:yes gene_type:complete